jgi:hypothetical protein
MRYKCAIATGGDSSAEAGTQKRNIGALISAAIKDRGCGVLVGGVVWEEGMNEK